MAGPSIFVRVLGDLTGLGKSFTEAQGKGQSAAAGMHSAFSGMLNQLNSTGVLGPFGSALQTADQQIQAMEGHAKKTSDKMIGIGGAAAGVGFALSALGSKDQAAHQQLQASVQATGHSYDQYSAQVEAAITHQEKFGHTADDTQGALRVLTSATHDPTEALKLLNTTTDLAAAKHEDLSTAAEQVGKAYNGSARIFKEFGVTVTKNTSGTKDYHKAIGDLGSRLSGQASAQANTFSGHLKDMKAVVSDQVSLFGQKFGPAIGTAGLALAGFGSAMKGAQAATKAFKDQTILSSAATKIATAAQWLFDAALDANPVVLIVLAVIALIAVVLLIITHFKAFKKIIEDVWHTVVKAFDAIWKAIKVAFDFVKAHWQEFAAALLLAFGPIGAIIAGLLLFHKQIIAFFTALPGDILTALGDLSKLLIGVGKDILNGFLAGVDWVWQNLLVPYFNFYVKIVTVIGDLTKTLVQVGKDVLNGFLEGVDWVWKNLLVPYFDLPVKILGLVGYLGGLLVGVGGSVISGLLSGLQSAWGTVTGWFAGLGAGITSVTAHMWDGIFNAFKAVINFLIDGWNSLKFTTPSVDILGFHTPSVTLGVPPIPHLTGLAEGGLITKTGLFYGHAGEAITPAPATMGGPFVSVGEQHFHGEADMDAFMRRVAWLARSRGARLGAA
jgi:hypothetical protein